MVDDPHDDDPRGERSLRGPTASWRPALIVAGLYLAVALPLLGDYGPTWDVVMGPYPLGDAVVAWLGGAGEGADFATYARSLPVVPMRAPYPDFHVVQSDWVESYPLAGTVSALSSKWLWDALGWVPAVAAHQLVLPLAVALLLILMVRFAARNGAGVGAGVLGALLLVASPRVFAHGMSNLKDVPTMLLFTAAVFAAYAACTATPTGARADLRRWALVGLLVGLTAAQKLNVLFIPVQVGAFCLLGRLAPFRPDGAPAPRVPWLAAPVVAAVAALALLAVSPAYWSDTITHMGEHLGFRLGNNLLLGGTTGLFDRQGDRWLEPLSVLWTAPLPVLLLAPVGLLAGRAPRRLRLLLALGVLEPVARTTLPGWPHYDGVRHVLELQPFLALSAGLGAMTVAGMLSEQAGRLGRRAIVALVAAAALTPGALATAATHPLGICWFNGLVGGVAGARARGVHHANDYWAASFWPGMAWIGERAAPGEVLIAPVAEHVAVALAPVRLPDGVSVRTRAADVAPDDPAPVWVMTLYRPRWHGPMARVLTSDDGPEPAHVLLVQGEPVLFVHRFDTPEGRRLVASLRSRELLLERMQVQVSAWIARDEDALPTLAAWVDGARAGRRSESLAALGEVFPGLNDQARIDLLDWMIRRR